MSFSLFTGPIVAISSNKVSIYFLFVPVSNFFQVASYGSIVRGGIMELGERAVFMDHQSRWNFDKHVALIHIQLPSQCDHIR